MPKLATTGTLPPLNILLRRALLRQLDATEIHAEARRQIERFCHACGHPPAHIDGHQHVHCFPVIRDVVYALATEYGCSVRNSATSWPALRQGHAALTKAAVINFMGTGFTATLRHNNIPHNRQFFGLHAFNPAQDIRTLYAAWLTAAQDNTLINCHPGIDAPPSDPLAAWRAHEYRFLQSAAFTALLDETQCRLGKFMAIA